MKTTVIGLAMALMCVAPVAAQEAAFDAQARVTEALEAVRPIAMNRDQVDWAAVETQARAIAAQAHDSVDLLPAYHLIVWSLHDEHSFMQPTPDQFNEWLRRTDSRRYLPDTPRPRASVSEFKRRPVSDRDLALPNGAKLRLVVVPAFSGDDPGNAFAQSISDAIGARPGACGYVVDLRGNTGGNMGPMLGGLSPLLGLGYTMPAIAGPGIEGAVLKVEDGRIAGYLPGVAEGMTMGELPRWPEGWDLSSVPVAVLLDQATASSGEAVAVALRGRSHTRFFGEKTFGVASGNQDIPLSDGVTLHVAIALLQDSDGRTYPNGIEPDDAVTTGPGDPQDPDDAVVETAKLWLSGQDACQG